MAKGYEANILRAFRLLLKQGHVYRGLKPVLVVPDLRNRAGRRRGGVPGQDLALDLCRVQDTGVESRVLEGRQPALRTRIVIWTTTPWTLPANRAVAFNPTLRYTFGRRRDQRLETRAPHRT